jgi:hypothetical protein
MTAHRRQRGQIVWLMVLCAIPIALGLGYLFNSAELMSRKVRAQNAADAAALSQATWMARSMNVMATNNVAFVQTEAILVANSAVELTVTDLFEYQMQEGATQGARAISTCPGIPYTAVACAKAIYKLIQLYLSARAMENLVALATAAGKLGRDADAFAQSNDELANNFWRFSADMQRSLAQANGLTDPPLISPVVWDENQNEGERNVLRGELMSTGLPVERIDWGHGVDMPADRLAQIWKLLRPVQSMGYEAQHRELFFSVGRNFKDHGYSDQNGNPSDDGDEIGPWAMARNDVKDALEKAEDHAKNADWDARWSEEDPEYDDCWDSASTFPSVPVAFDVGIPCVEGALVNPDRMAYLYGPAAPENGDWDAWGVTDVLALTKSTRARNFVAPKRFVNKLSAAYGIAKARVYTATAPDLYSSDWHATLVPTLSYDGDGGLPPEFRRALDRLVNREPGLANYMNRFRDEELALVLSR